MNPQLAAIIARQYEYITYRMHGPNVLTQRRRLEKRCWLTYGTSPYLIFRAARANGDI